jgi:hypothetical protein
LCPSGSNPVSLQQCAHSYFCPALLEMVIVLLFHGRQVAFVSVRIQSGLPATVSTQLFLSCTVRNNYCASISGRQIAVAFVRTLFEQCTKLSESCTVRNNSCHLSSGKTRGSEEGNISRGPCYSMFAVVLTGSFLNLHPSANTAKIDPPSLLDFFHSVWRERSA